MYHPYFRGKQFELVAIRESAELLAESGFTPIVEPVKGALGGLERALNAVCDADGTAIVIINPGCGDHAEDGGVISNLLNEKFIDKPNINAGILLKGQMSVADAMIQLQEHSNHNPVFVHAGFTEAKALSQALGESLSSTHHVFVEQYCGKLYWRHFRGSKRILLRDGFRKAKRNADHPESEEFSDLHITYTEEGMDGFGDFLVVGDDFTEGGGPAYAVAIHLTYIDPNKDEAMYIYHFLSTTNNTPTDPAGKFGQALDKLIMELESGHSMLFEGASIREFRELHKKRHFPGLGYVKKLAMKHHIETLSNFLS